MLGLLGKKVGMTQIFNEEGKQIPVTVIEVGPCRVTDVRTKERDGYTAVQVGFGSIAEKRVTKAKKGHLGRSDSKNIRYLKEMRTDNIEGVEVGQELSVDNFEVGDFVDIKGVSKGQGFQGVVKRHGYSGGEAAHGSKFGRQLGSSGQAAYPARVIKGVGMPGQMGNKIVTTQNIEVVKVDIENNLLVVKGAVPGANNKLLTVMLSLKKGSDRNWKVPASGEAKNNASNPDTEVIPSEESSDEKSTANAAEKKPEAESSEENKS